MIFVGLGLRRDACMASFATFSQQLSLPLASPIGISAHLGSHPLLAELRAIGHDVQLFSLEDLSKARCLTQSPRILALYGVESLAEAAALCRAKASCLGPQRPTLKQPRQVSACRRITLALAHIGDPS